MESLDKFIASEKAGLSDSAPKIGRLFDSLLDSMSNLPSLFPLYIDKTFRETDFNSKVDFYPSDPYVHKSLDSGSKENKRYLSYLGKHIHFARIKILRNVENEAAVPSEVEASIRHQREVVDFYSQFYETHKNPEVLKKLPKNTARMVCGVTVPFFRSIHHLLSMEYNLAVKNLGVDWYALANEEKEEILLKANLAKDLPYVNEFMTGDLNSLYTQYLSLYKTERETPPSSHFKPIEKKESPKYKDLAEILFSIESVLGEVNEIALARSRGKEVSFKYQTPSGGDYLLSRHISEIAKVRAETEQNKLDRDALRNILRKSNNIISGVWMEGSKSIKDIEISKKLIELDRLLEKIHIK